MTLSSFMNSLKGGMAPSGMDKLLQALWFDAKNNWEEAHSIVDSGVTVEEAWVHAYLHRKEGDVWNANYWYRRAGRAMPSITHKQEWETLVFYFLKAPEAV